MNQTSEVLATLIHYNVAVRDTLEYCLNKPQYDTNLFQDKKRSILIEVTQYTFPVFPILTACSKSSW